MDKVPMTPQGHAKLKEELRQLKDVERPKVSAEIGVAREHGDLRENAEYHAAKDKQGLIEARINDIEDKLARAEVIDVSALGGSKIKFGAFVKLEESNSGKLLEYRIVGPEEANLEGGSISVTSPMARAMIGREVGDEVQVRAPGGVKVYEVLEVRWS
jgi:transcription elongation factor GreA